jgi:hypothetical protein
VNQDNFYLVMDDADVQRDENAVWSLESFAGTKTIGKDLTVEYKTIQTTRIIPPRDAL